MEIQTIDLATYERERAICDKAQAYFSRVSETGFSITAEQAAHPDYAACDNEMRGRVEQFEILRDLPSDFVAYLGKPLSGVYPVTVWAGQPLGKATRGAVWQSGGRWTSATMAQFYATIGGRKYTGRGQGAGMCIRFKETAASRRKRGEA